MNKISIVNRTFFLIIYLGFFCLHVKPNDVYILKPKKDIIIGLTALCAATPSIIFNGTAEELKSKESINWFDRNTIYSYNKKIDNISTALTYGTLIMPGISIFPRFNEFNNVLTYGVMFSEAFLFTMATKNFMKLAIPRNRPYTYIAEIPSGEKDDYFNSFPSGHAAYAFMGATFLTTTFLKEYTQNKWKILLIASGYSLASGISIMRVTSGNHFITDVIAGGAIGSFYGWFIPKLHEKKNNNSKLTFIPGGNMIYISYTF